MNDILYTTLQLATMLIAAIIARYVVPWLKEKIGEQRLDEIAAWTVWAVDWAEQIIVTPGSGAERKAIVTEFLKHILKQKNIALSDKQIDVLIESAVRQMNTAERLEKQPDPGEFEET